MLLAIAVTRNAHDKTNTQKEIINKNSEMAQCIENGLFK